MELVTFVRSRAYDARIAAMKMTDEQECEIESIICENPGAGEIVPGCGGARKLRLAYNDHGKRGGARVIYFVIDEKQIVHLLYAYSKKEMADLSSDMKEAIYYATKQILKAGKGGARS